MPRRPKNLRPDLNGMLVIDKPAGPSSFAVCRAVRRASGGAKVGHAGTLDPLASGVLLVCLGSATRAIDRLMATEKRYLADIDLAAFSTTDDMEGQATPVPIRRPPTRDHVIAASATFIGEIMQSPPAFSAVHVGGERAYKLARRGEAPELPPRPVVVHGIDVLAYDFPFLRLDIRCGKGTYIRSLARDLGVALGTGGRLAALRRTAVGLFTLDGATSLAALPERIEPHHLRAIDSAPNNPAATPT